jgi:zinc protease
MDRVLADLRQNGVTEAELERAKKNELADFVYQSDSQSSLARRYGWGLIVGRSLKDIDGWPDAIRRVTREEVQKVAAKYFDPRRSVTGTLLPEPEAEARSASGAPPAAARTPAKSSTGNRM